MARSSLGLLGSIARALRAAHAERVLALARDAADACFVRLGRPPLRAQAGGIELRGFLRHRSFLAAVADDAHEAYVSRLLLDEIRDDTVFVDVGAHVGLYTLLAAPRAARVIAFEADPYTARALAANVRGAGAANVRVVSAAAQDHVGPSSFWPSPGTYGSSRHRRPSAGAVRPIEVAGTTVDAEVGAGADDVVAKVDAEGAELDVLAGMRETIAAASRVVLLVEVNPVALREAGHSPAELLERLRGLGLGIARIDEATRSVSPLGGGDTGDWKGNLLCRKP